MSAEVVFEAAGDHAFDLGHLRQQGGEELLLHLLREAGLDDRRWRLRIEKKVACGAETRPVTVVGFKPWCCYVKIKPGDNDSGHYCSLLMPDGLRGEAVYEALKGAEERIDRNWRNGSKEPPQPQRPATAEEPDAPAPAEPAEVPAEETGRVDLRSWGKEPEKIRLALLAIHEMEQAGPWPTRDDVVSAVADRLGWKDANRQAISSVCTGLVRSKYLCQAGRGNRGAGYTLTDKGRQLIQDLLAPPPPAPPATAAAVSAEQLSQGLEGFTQRFTEASQWLRAIKSRREELLAEIARLDEEARDLERLLGNTEVQDLIQRLLSLTSYRFQHLFSERWEARKWKTACFPGFLQRRRFVAQPVLEQPFTMRVSTTPFPPRAYKDVEFGRGDSASLCRPRAGSTCPSLERSAASSAWFGCLGRRARARRSGASAWACLPQAT